MGASGVLLKGTGQKSVTVKKSPTVPVFVGFFYDENCVRMPITTGCIKVNDSQHLRRLFPNAINCKVIVTNDKATVDFGHELQDVLAIQHYFDNGGGPCYILPIAHGNKDDLLTPITAHPEISLLALATPTTLPTNTYTGLAELLQLSEGYFLIWHATAATAAPVVPAAYHEHTASYFPFIKITTEPWRNDEHIPVAGLDETQFTSLATLKEKNPGLYSQADQLIRNRHAELTKSHTIAPSAAVAAAYCQTDRIRGVWKAPANVIIENAVPCKFVSEAEHSDYNAKGINVIRTINGKSTIWGARTGYTSPNQWRYISVRRLCNQVQRDVTLTLATFAGQRNAEATWIKVKAAIDSYLYNIWQLGGLMGEKPEDGYSVSIEMTPEEIADGKLIATIELAAARPAEFIVLRCSQLQG